jgi:ABC-type Fe3+-siderophore transport system permease subunit
MRTRRFLAMAAAGSAAAAALFFVLLDSALDREQWSRATVAGVAFGLFMAVWNGGLITADSRQRTTRNVVFEHSLAEFGAVMGIAWALAPAVGHLRWQDLSVYTAIGLPALGLVWLITRRQIAGEHPDDLFV